MKTTALQRHLFAALCLAGLAVCAPAAPPEITARLEPQSLALGESARLIVTIKGSQAADPRMPDVDGLEIASAGQQSTMQIVNGAVTASVTHIYEVTPSRAGSLTIPPISAAGAGSTQPLTLRVDKSVGGQTHRAPSQGRSQLPAPKIDPDDAAPVDGKGQSAFLRVVLPKRELTVGELVPVEVKAYFRAGVSATLNGLPVLSSDAFTLNKLSDKPEQAREMIDGAPYTVVTWTTALSAVKAGDYPLNLDLPVMVRTMERGQRRAGGRSPFQGLFGDDFGFDDSFFDNFFGGLTEKPLTLHTDGAIVKIKALPTQGRPADFSGAVGKFDVTAGATGTTCAAGDPLTLKIVITGEGNFDRVTTNGLPASADWKTYKPNARFEPADRSNTSGTKTFEQSIIPAKSGAQEIPAVSFSYFDPGTGTYVTRKTAPLAVEIAPAAAATPADAKPAAASVDNVSKADPDGLAPDKPVPARATSSLRPLVLTPWFIAANAAMLGALVIGLAVRAIRARRARDPGRLQREAEKRALNEWLSMMDVALDKEDAPRFFGAARRALQERLAAQWNIPAGKVTIPEICARLNGRGEEVRAVFQAADEIAYSGTRFTAPALRQWRDLVIKQLNHFAPI